MAWTKLCCAIDFSRLSQAAMLEAARLAQRDGASLTLVHVFPPPVTVAAAGAATLTAEELEARMRVELGGRLEGAKSDALATAPGIRVETFLCSGSPAEEVARLARLRGFDLLVVGTHGHTGLRRLVLGSVAEHLARIAPCPVLVYRPTPRDVT